MLRKKPVTLIWRNHANRARRRNDRSRTLPHKPAVPETQNQTRTCLWRWPDRGAAPLTFTPCCIALVLCLVTALPATAGGDTSRSQSAQGDSSQTLSAQNSTAGDGTARPATQWARLLNDPGFAKIVTLESGMLDRDARALSAHIYHVRTRIESYRAMQRNTHWFPDRHIIKALGSIVDLADIAVSARDIAQSGRALDAFLRSGQVTDPKFGQALLDERNSAQAYTNWILRWDRHMADILEHMGWAPGDTADKNAPFGEVAVDVGSAKARREVLRSINIITAFMERAIAHLVVLTSAQAQTVRAAWEAEGGVGHGRSQGHLQSGRP